MDDTWTCHVCGDERPDALIGVQTFVSTGTVPASINVRYCVDRDSCARGAADTSLAGMLDRLNAG